MTSIMICSVHEIFFWGDQVEEDEMNGTYVTYGNLKEKRPLVRPRCRREANIKMDIKIYDGRAWIRLAWLMIGTSSRILWI